MKFVNSVISIAVLLFLFFTFSNYNSVDDILQSIGNKNEPFEQTPELIKEDTSNEIGLEKVIVHDVIDGDTIKVELSDRSIETVRLLLIDTPETVKPDTPIQPFGEEASEYMKKKLIKDTVIEIERGIEERDKYNRLLAYVYVNGEQINKELVREGLARVAFVYEPNTKHLDELNHLEDEAKNKRVGIWSIENYVTENGFNH